jgi:CRISPR/Cas system CMR-associated protein Cmr5 small subunit
MQLAEQKLARIAFQKIQEAKSNQGKLEDFRKLPAVIQSSGLGQTIAFYMKKNKDVADALSAGTFEKDARESLKALTEMNAGEYRRISRRALAYASWLKRFAEVEGD